MDTNPQQEVADPVDDLLDVLNSTNPPEAEEAEEADEVAEAQGETDDSDEEAQPGQAEELEDVELEGKTFKLPKEVKEAVLRQKDYTQKTQQLAELRRAVEDKAHYVEAVEQIRGAAFKEASELQSLQSQLEQFETLDWNALIAEDAQRALQLNIARSQLQGKVTEKQRALQALIQQSQQSKQLHEQKQIEMGQQELARRVGKITDKDRDRMLQAASELGFDRSDMHNPRALHALHLAAKYLDLQKAKPQAMKKVAEAPKAIRPQAVQPKAQRTQEALKRLKTTGRPEELMKFL